MRRYFATACIAALLIGSPAYAVTPPYPAATLPLTGTETIICWQGGVTKDCQAQNLTQSLPPVDVRTYGAKCDHVTDDATAINAALTAAVLVSIPPGLTCAYGSALSLPSGHGLVGPGIASGFANGPSLKALNQNIDGIDAGSFTLIRDLSINCGAAGTDSSGTCVNYTGSQSTLLSNVLIQSPWLGIAMNSTLNTVQNVQILDPTASSGECIKLNGGNDQVIWNTFCEGIDSSHQPRTCLDIADTGALYMWRFSCLFGGNGKIYDPSAGQTVNWIWDDDGTYDSGSQSGILYSPASGSPGGVIKGVYENHTWTSSNAGWGVDFVAAAGAVMDDIHFTDHRSYANGEDGMNVGNGVTNLFIKGGSFCGNSTVSSGTSNGITYGNITHLSIMGVKIGPCATFVASQGYAIAGTSASADWIDIEGNDLQGNVTGTLSLTSPTLSATAARWTITNNIGVDDTVPTISSATSIAAPVNPTFIVTGTTTVTTITGLWQGRKYTIIPSGALPFNTGGNIGAACTATASLLVSGVAAGTATYVKC